MEPNATFLKNNYDTTGKTLVFVISDDCLGNSLGIKSQPWSS